jgi:membrane-associated phospholipid phosphatase
MKPVVSVILCLILFGNRGVAQNDSLLRDVMSVNTSIVPGKNVYTNKYNNDDASAKSRLYNVHPKWQLPLAGATVVLSSMAFKALDKNASLTPSEALKLNPNDINAFDRPTALRDPANFKRDASTGDLFLNFSVASPALLALDKHMRKEWVDLLTLYLATQAFDNMLYFGAIIAVRRPRPFAYNPALDSVARSGVGLTKSFFSGHVSFSASGTFFAVKVFTDYHNIKGWNRILLYTAAAVPPLVTGYFRVASGRHFKTDVIAGLLAGATSGILVPELFKRKEYRSVSFSPYYVPQGGGLSMALALNNGKAKTKSISLPPLNN